MAGPWRVRTRKPHGAVRVNQGHPLAKDIAFFYYETYGSGSNAAGFYDAVTGNRTGTQTSISAKSSTDPIGGGRTVLTDSSGTSSAISSTAFQNPRGIQTTAGTVFCRYKIDTKPSGASAVPVFFGNSGFRGPIVAVNTSGNIGGGLMTTAGLVATYDSVDHTGEWVSSAGAAEGTGGGGYAWANGKPLTNPFGGSSSAQAYTNVWVFRDPSGYFRSLLGEIGVVIGWTRVLSTAEIAEVHANPWRLLLPANDLGWLSLDSGGAAGIEGTASITEAGDTVAATGTVQIQGSASITEAGDTAAATGTLALQATAAITEADDTSSATGTVQIQGAASITEGDDTSAATGALQIQGAASITEADDTVVATGVGTATTSGVADITEADDTVAATGTLQIQGTASITEAGDTASATGTLQVQGTAAVTEADDTVASTGTVNLQASASITEGDDTAAATATLKIVATASITEAGDTVAATGVDAGAVILISDPVFTVRVPRPRRSVTVSNIRRISRVR